jgi:hypothetical protein
MHRANIKNLFVCDQCREQREISTSSVWFLYTLSRQWGSVYLIVFERVFNLLWVDVSPRGPIAYLLFIYSRMRVCASEFSRRYLPLWMKPRCSIKKRYFAHRLVCVAPGVYVTIGVHWCNCPADRSLFILGHIRRSRRLGIIRPFCVQASSRLWSRSKLRDHTDHRSVRSEAASETRLPKPQ